MAEEKVTKFYSLLSDSTFKYLFKNSTARPILEKIVYEICGINLSDYKLLDNELNSGNMIKDYRLDLLFKKENNIVLIEMNKEVNNYVLNKNHRYLYRAAGNMYNEGENYNKKKYATLLNFNNCNFPIKDMSGILTYEFMNDKYKLKIGGIKSVGIYLENFKGTCYNGSNLKESYLSIFTAESYEEMRKIAGDNKEVLILVDEIEKLNEDKYFGLLYDAEVEQKMLENSARQDGYEEGQKAGVELGYEQGLKAGISQEKINIAKSMKNKNMDINLISELTGLNVKEKDML